jgi:hypothetical protein
MKGLVFKEFMNMVENQFGYDMVDNIIVKSNLKSNGAYTSVGTYDHAEMIQLVMVLSKETNVPAATLVKNFGRSLIPVFKKGFPGFFEKKDTFQFLESLNDYIHVEVKKLYNDAELPEFKIKSRSEKELVLDYMSKRPMADLAEGLIEALIEQYEENISLATTGVNGIPTSRTFILTKR